MQMPVMTGPRRSAPCVPTWRSAAAVIVLSANVLSEQRIADLTALGVPIS